MIFNRNRITLFCLIGSVFGVSLTIGMMSSKPISSPSVKPPSTPPYVPLIAPTKANVTVPDAELRYIHQQFVRTTKLYSGSDFQEIDGHNNDKAILNFGASAPDSDIRRIEDYPSLIIDYCRDMAGSATKYGFHDARSKKLVTADYLLTDDEYEKGKMICLKYLIDYEMILHQK